MDEIGYVECIVNAAKRTDCVWTTITTTTFFCERRDAKFHITWNGYNHWNLSWMNADGRHEVMAVSTAFLLYHLLT